ncbi:MAG TPA: TonB-dependent receptor, partial [Chitinophagaceae bacterium]
MKTRLIKSMVFCLLACSTSKLYSQAIFGVVYNDSSKAISQITVSLLNAGDSSLVKADLTDYLGGYEFHKLKTGRYMMIYSGVGFETHFSSSFSMADNQVVYADTVYLKIAAKQLQAVNIHGKKGLFQVSADKTVFNVQNSINATGSNALELLQKSPGVSIDNNENISMKGKAGVRIYVDGRILQLNNEDVAAYLKSINSNDIESIEFISNPGAKYDASGNAGIINFRLRKNLNFGTNASISAGMIQGVTPKGTGALSVNHRNKLINVFGNASGNIGRHETLITAPRIQKDTLYDQHLRQLNYSKSLNFKVGIDYFIGKKQTIGLMNTTSLSKEDWDSYGNTAIYYQPSNGYVKKLVALNEIPRERTSSNTNINYRYAEANGTEINFDGDYGFYRGRANSHQPNEYISFDGTVLSQITTYNNTPTDIDIYTAKVDVKLPAWKGKLAFGAKF